MIAPHTGLFRMNFCVILRESIGTEVGAYWESLDKNWFL